MTSGSLSRTSGGGDLWRWLDHPRLGPLLTVALVGIVLVFVNVSTVLAEHAASGHSLAVWKPLVWETSSLAIIVAMAPAIGAAVRRWPPRREGLARFGLIHGALTIPFALVHVAGAFLMRSAAYWVMDERYGFFDNGVATRVLYEWRKDVLVYAGIGLVYALFQSRRVDVAATPPVDRIEIHDAGVTRFLVPAEILFIEAAGNYVEFHTAARKHLVRGTLAAWETRLGGNGFVRVHRARLINHAHVRAVRRTPSGDIEITLDDTRTLMGSRRYRTALR